MTLSDLVEAIAKAMAAGRLTEDSQVLSLPGFYDADDDSDEPDAPVLDLSICAESSGATLYANPEDDRATLTVGRLLDMVHAADPASLAFDLMVTGEWVPDGPYMVALSLPVVGVVTHPQRQLLGVVPTSDVPDLPFEPRPRSA